MNRLLLSTVVLCCACFGVTACNAPKARAQPDQIPSMAEIAAQVNQRLEANARSSPPFDSLKWGQLAVGMSPKSVASLLGPPLGVRIRNGGANGIQTTWFYVFDGGATEKVVQFGVPLPPGPVLEGKMTVDPQTFNADDLKILPGDLFDWTGRNAATAVDEQRPAKADESSTDKK